MRKPAQYIVQLPISLPGNSSSKLKAMRYAQFLADSWNEQCGVYKRVATAKPRKQKAKKED